jgi:starch synthase (maltosyl-transferring)
MRDFCRVEGRRVRTGNDHESSRMERRTSRTKPLEGRRRVVIEGVSPEIDCGRFPAKRTAGDAVAVEADIFTDGHDAIGCVMLWRPDGARTWRETPMEPLGNDRWRATFDADRLGIFRYTFEAWVSPSVCR